MTAKAQAVMPIEAPFTRRVSFEYTNHRGEPSRRLVVPIEWIFGTSPWHPEPQWLLSAMDVDKEMAVRHFAARDMRNVTIR